MAISTTNTDNKPWQYQLNISQRQFIGTETHNNNASSLASLCGIKSQADHSSLVLLLDACFLRHITLYLQHKYLLVDTCYVLLVI